MTPIKVRGCVCARCSSPSIVESPPCHQFRPPSHTCCSFSKRSELPIRRNLLNVVVKNFAVKREGVVAPKLGRFLQCQLRSAVGIHDQVLSITVKCQTELLGMDRGRTHIAVECWCGERRDHRTQASVAPTDDPPQLLMESDHGGPRVASAVKPWLTSRSWWSRRTTIWQHYNYFAEGGGSSPFQA